MVEQFSRHENICPYLHLPVQSGSDNVLRRMGRGYTCDEYMTLVDSLKAARPDIALSTDLIVGFPGESDEEFAATMRLVESVRFSSIFAFKYSPRPGTAAPKLGPPVEMEVADQRLQSLLARQQEIQRSLNEELEGAEREVLVTGMGRRPGTMNGRTSCHRIVHFPLEDDRMPIGRLVRVRIEQAMPHSLLGTLVPAAAT
jgi:tRNA-2-methylthio-N6-dimethylallyladenosine synthase